MTELLHLDGRRVAGHRSPPQGIRFRYLPPWS
jgi:hypothetical protein